MADCTREATPSTRALILKKFRLCKWTHTERGTSPDMDAHTERNKSWSRHGHAAQYRYYAITWFFCLMAFSAWILAPSKLPFWRAWDEGGQQNWFAYVLSITKIKYIYYFSLMYLAYIILIKHFLYLFQFQFFCFLLFVALLGIPSHLLGCKLEDDPRWQVRSV